MFAIDKAAKTKSEVAGIVKRKTIWAEENAKKSNMKFNGKFDIIKYVSQLLVAMLMNISVAYRMLLSVIPYKTAFYIDSCAPARSILIR